MVHKTVLLAVFLLLMLATPALGVQMQGEWESALALSFPPAGADWQWQTGLRLAGDVPLTEEYAFTLRLSMLANSQNTDLTGTLERGYLQYEAGTVRLRLGRQAVSWGAGWFFRPTDLITPRSPLSPEATRPGMDLFSVTWATSPVTALEGVAGEDLAGARIGWQVGRTGIRFLALVEPGDLKTVGFDLQGGLGGFYGEAVYTWTDVLADGKAAATIGWQRMLDSNRSIYLEYLHDEQGRFSFGRNCLAAGLDIPRDELTTYTLAVVGNLDDGGGMLTGLVSLLLTDNLDLRAGIGTILGPEGTELLTLAGNSRWSLNVQVKYYF